MSRLTQSTLIIGCLVLLLGFLQTRDENDRRADLLAQFQRSCIPTKAGERAVAEWINGRLTCITYQGFQVGQVARVVRTNQITTASAGLPSALSLFHPEQE